MGQIYLVRHGQASFGSADYDRLSPLGIEQGRLLGVWFSHCAQRFDHVVRGGLRRHQQTADACIGAMPKDTRIDIEWHTDSGLNEYDFDAVITRHRPDLADNGALARLLADPSQGKAGLQRVFEQAMARWMGGEHDADYGEPWPAFQQRCVGALQRLAQLAGPGQTVAVFTSGGVIAALCQHLLGLEHRQMAELNWSLANCAVTKLFCQRGELSLSYLNNFAHLEWLGEAGAVTYR